MRTRTSTYQANGYGGEDYGKCICVSFPNHETDLIEEADIQTKLTGSASRSHLFRMYLRDARIQRKQRERASQSAFSSVMGDN